MRSSIDGGGNVFWASGKKGFNGANKVDFAITNDRQWNEYAVKIDAPGNIRNLRIDTGNQMGEATFNWIQLFDGQNKLVKDWKFEVE